MDNNFDNFIERHIIPTDHILYEKLFGRCLLSNNVFNDALYAIRQHYFYMIGKKYTDLILPECKETILFYSDLQKYLSSNSENYKALSANAAQLTVKDVCKTVKSFFELLKKVKDGTYDKKVTFPKYRPSGDVFVVKYNKQALLGNGSTADKIRIPKTDIVLDIKVQHWEKMTQLWLVPKFGCIEIVIDYREEETQFLPDNGNNLTIDLGIDNLATCVSNVMKPFIIDGRPVKTRNDYYNKTVASEYSYLDTVVNKEVWTEINKIKYSTELSDEEKKSLLYLLYKKIVRTTDKLNEISLYRRNFILDYFHKASSYIVNQAVENNITTIYIGRNKNWKQETNMGSVNNQKFVCIPHAMLIHMITYKAKKHGIRVILVEESYTSKASFINDDFIPVYDENDNTNYTFSGYRKSRGLYKIKNSNIVINAGVNGAYNIMRKALNANTSDLWSSVKGLVFCPKRVSLLKQRDSRKIKEKKHRHNKKK